MKTILLTGATGFLGKEILSVLIRKNPDSVIYCLVRPTEQETGTQRIQRITSSENVIAIEGDVSIANLGLSEDDYRHCIEHIDTIIHSAASTKFNAPSEYLKLHNITATQNMISLAKDIYTKQNQKAIFVYVSTAYQAGKSDFVVEEKFIEKPTIGFKNNYEKSKWTTEQLLKQQLGNCHLYIVRPSIIMAHDSGKCYKDGVGIGVFGLLAKKSKVMPSPVPVTSRLVLDFVTVDFVATSIVDLLSASNDIPSGTIFHLTDFHGGMSGREGILIVNKTFGIKMVGVNIRIVKFIVSFLEKYSNLISERDKRVFRAYLDYFGTNPRFATDNLKRYLDREVETISSGQVFKRALEYWQINIKSKTK